MAEENTIELQSHYRFYTEEKTSEQETYCEDSKREKGIGFRQKNNTTKEDGMEERFSVLSCLELWIWNLECKLKDHSKVS